MQRLSNGSAMPTQCLSYTNRLTVVPMPARIMRVYWDVLAACTHGERQSWISWQRGKRVMIQKGSVIMAMRRAGICILETCPIAAGLASTMWENCADGTDKI